MTRRPLLGGGVVVLALGCLVLGLGLTWGRGDAAAARAAPTGQSTIAAAPGAAPDAAVSPGTPSESVTSSPSSGADPVGGPAEALPRPKQSSAPPSPPTSEPRLHVAAIDLDIPLHAGGVDSSGAVVPPPGRAIWVRGFGRVSPGEIGTAVVAGHVSSPTQDDVFARLSSIRVGHEVVLTSGGITRRYVVRRAEVVTKSALTRDADVWGQNASHRRVVLITCDDDLGYRRDGHRVANYVVVAEET